jgi:hypothetical protein
MSAGIIFVLYHTCIRRHGCNTAIASRNSDRLKKVLVMLNTRLKNVNWIFVYQAAEKLMYATGKRCIPVQMDVRNVCYAVW